MWVCADVSDDPLSYALRAERAYRQVDTQASAAQRRALRQRTGHLRIHGLDIRVEYPPGSTRCGMDPSGRIWCLRMRAGYGRIKRTAGPTTGRPIDVYLGPRLHSRLVFVVNQLTPDGNLDEHKVILGTMSLIEARRLYLAHYPKDWAATRLGEIQGFLMDDFREWLRSSAPVKSRSSARTLRAKRAENPARDSDQFLDSVLDALNR